MSTGVLEMPTMLDCSSDEGRRQIQNESYTYNDPFNFNIPSDSSESDFINNRSNTYSLGGDKQPVLPNIRGLESNSEEGKSSDNERIKLSNLKEQFITYIDLISMNIDKPSNFRLITENTAATLLDFYNSTIDSISGYIEDLNEESVIINFIDNNENLEIAEFNKDDMGILDFYLYQSLSLKTIQIGDMIYYWFKELPKIAVSSEEFKDEIALVKKDFGISD